MPQYINSIREQNDSSIIIFTGKCSSDIELDNSHSIEGLQDQLVSVHSL